MGKEREIEALSVPWMEEFRKAIEAYLEKRADPILPWFLGRYEKGEFEDDFHCLLTILAHARFDQTDDPLRALENTQRVVAVLVGRNIALDAIPALEGTGFCSGEQWRDLFYRAMPKLQQVCQGVLERRKWKALEVQTLAQVIPYMSEKSSRKAVRWISELMGSVVDIDFSNMPVSIDSNLYRVACRLGVVDPHFDVYRGRNSMGDLRIQAFAASAFPDNPSRIEEAMSWVGSAENGGHCLPVEPQCEGCPFESFCPRLCFHFDPSEKGMSTR
jgi:hypothetical protein